MSKIKETTATSSVNTYSVLATGTTLKGDINSDEDFRIDGAVEGTIVCKGKIIVGQNSVINADIECANIELLGQVKGNIKCTQGILLRATSQLTGNISTKTIEIEPGAKFIGNCAMLQE